MSFFKKVVATLGVKIYTFGVNFLVSIVVVRLLGSDGKGDLALLTNFYTLVVAFSFLSLGSGFIYHFRKNQDGKKFISTFLVFGLSLLLSLIAIGYLFSNQIKERFLPQISEDLYYLSFCFLAIVVIAKINEGLSRAFYSARAFNLAIVIEKFCYTLTAIFEVETYLIASDRIFPSR